jgi:hypothetical protein
MSGKNLGTGPVGHAGKTSFYGAIWFEDAINRHLEAEVDEQTSHALAMTRLFMGYMPTRVIYAAAKLGIMDEIAANGSTAEEIAQVLGLNGDAVFRAMRVLSGIGVVHQDQNNKFHVTPLGQTICSNAPNSVRDYLIHSHELVIDGFMKITDSIRTGKPVHDDIYQYLREDSARQSLFHAAMGSRGRIETIAVLDAYDFGDCNCVVDVGGGNGTFLSSILEAQPHVSGILFDQPSAIEAARNGHGGPLPRCELVPGDFYSEIPVGGDAYILKRILFSETDDQKRSAILRNCRAAMEKGARLLIIEPLIDRPNIQLPAHQYDMTFLVVLAGQVRTADEYSILLGQCDFQVEKIIPTESDVSVLVARAK